MKPKKKDTDTVSEENIVTKKRSEVEVKVSNFEANALFVGQTTKYIHFFSVRCLCYTHRQANPIVGREKQNS